MTNLPHPSGAVRFLHGLRLMRYTAKLTRNRSKYCAECVELEAIGEGPTREAAVEALRAELQDRLEPVEGVAPPSRPVRTALEIVVLNEPGTIERAPSGPGDSV
jgi:hypothetical protein